ncbi:uncharacterized protein V1518DRAFT_75016 [Limtongia smithiae]|uniref:uncharacterized protein n=1 Tax=Limtongia smithiae TaxID=1125753 RepID=UPI0034CE27A3
MNMAPKEIPFNLKLVLAIGIVRSKPRYSTLEGYRLQLLSKLLDPADYWKTRYDDMREEVAALKRKLTDPTTATMPKASMDLLCDSSSSNENSFTLDANITMTTATTETQPDVQPVQISDDQISRALELLCASNTRKEVQDMLLKKFDYGSITCCAGLYSC